VGAQVITQWETYNKSFLCDGIRFMCGEQLGKGISREVFIYMRNQEYVVKIEVEARDIFQNVQEYMFWEDAKGCKDISRWLAPCIRISPHGNFMLQERTSPLTMKELNKKCPKIPIFLSDTKIGNWGRLPNGKIVCHDYGTHLAVQSMRRSPLKKADWWD